MTSSPDDASTYANDDGERRHTRNRITPCDTERAAFWCAGVAAISVGAGRLCRRACHTLRPANRRSRNLTCLHPPEIVNSMSLRIKPVCAPIGWLYWTIVSLGLPGLVDAQGKRADYERAANLRELTANKVFRDRVEPNWSEDGTRLWYRVRTAPDQHEFVVVDVEKGSRVPAFDHERLAAALQAVGIAQPPQRLLVDRLQWSSSDPSEEPRAEHEEYGCLEFRCGGKRWACNLESYELRELPALAAETGAFRPLQSVARGPKSSRRTGPETEVTFVNRTGGPVELFWLDADGKRRSYGRLQVDEERAQHTFAGHVWLLVDGGGEPLGVCVARERPMSVDVSRVLDSSDEKGTAESEEGDDDDRQGEANVGRRRNTSPDGQWSAFVRDYNVWLRNPESGEEFDSQLGRHFGRRLWRSILLVARFDHAGCRAYQSG